MYFLHYIIPAIRQEFYGLSMEYYSGEAIHNIMLSKLKLACYNSICHLMSLLVPITLLNVI